MIEGREAAVRVTFQRDEISPPFRAFVTDENRKGRLLEVDHLLLLRHLLRHPEIDTQGAARLCQRSESEMREILNRMDLDFGYLERGGVGRGTYWSIRPDLHEKLSGPGLPERDRRIDWEAAKTRVLSVLRQRTERGEEGLSNAEVRQLTHFDRHQVLRLVKELEDEGVRIEGHGRGARYVIAQ